MPVKKYNIYWNSSDWGFGVLGPMGPWAHGPKGPRSGKFKIPKSTSALEKNPRTFRIARIDPSRQGVMTQAIFVHGDMRFWPKNEEKGQKGLQIIKNPIPPIYPPCIFPSKEPIALTGTPLKGAVCNRCNGCAPWKTGVRMAEWLGQF